MLTWKRPHRFLFPSLMLLAGIALGGFWPQTPLHSVATDSSESFILATGFLDSDVEGVFLFDCLTGDIAVTVLGKSTGGFAGLFRYNVIRDMQIDLSKNPRFLMVTGVADLRTGGNRAVAGSSVVYIAELTTGKLAAYAVPWDRTRWNTHAPIQGVLKPVGLIQYRNLPTGEPIQSLH